MTSLPGVPTGASPLGDQQPRVCSFPPFASSSGDEASQLAARAGLVLDPWQRYVMRHALGERPDGRWSAFEVGLVVPRQNGKGSVLEARALAGLFLFGERLILHTAHEVKTAGEAFLRIKGLVDNTDEFRRRVKRINNTHGEEGIELLNGQRLRFLARSRVAGRGFSGDCVILDEAFELPEAAVAALLPTMSAKPNPQIWYTSTAPNQEKDKNAHVLARVRRRGMAPSGLSRLAYFEWSVDADGLNDAERKALRADPRAWSQANPGLGIRLSEEFTASELAALSPKDFDVERLDIGDWPDDDESAWRVIGRSAWAALVDHAAEPVMPVAFAADATPDQSYGSIAVAWRDGDGRVHVELTRAPDDTLDHRPGTAWMIPRLVELCRRWDPCALVIDPKRQANALIPGLEEAGVEVVTTSARDMAQACGGLYEAATDSRVLRHVAQPEVDAALARATKRELEGAWAWDGRTGVDISPLVAVTLAAWGHATQAHLWNSYDVLESVG
jgi:hypothetical protein